MWIEKETGPPSIPVKCEELKDLIEKSRQALIYFGEESEKLLKAHLKVAEIYSKVAFFHTDAECASQYGAKAPVEIFFRKFEEPVVVYDGKVGHLELNAWLKPLTIPIIFELAEEHMESIFSEDIPTLVLFRSEGDGEASYSKVFEEVAKASKLKCLFTWAYKDDTFNKEFSEFMGAGYEEGDRPILMALNPDIMRKYKYEGNTKEITVDILTQWMETLIDGSAPQFLKSEPIPETNDEPVKIVVGKTFNEIVKDPTKNVFLFMYAPWCEHCKNLQPIWDKLAESQTSKQDLVIAKFDATLNEPDGFEPEHYPMLMFFPKGENTSPNTYSAESRELEDLQKWLDE